MRIKKRFKRGMAFLLSLLMIFNSNMLVRAGDGGGDGATENIAYLYNETFDGTALPGGFSGVGTVDTQEKVLELNVLGDTNISITPVEGITTYTIEFDMMRVDTYEASTNNYMQFKMYDNENQEICIFDTQNSNLRIKYYEGTSAKYRNLFTDNVKYVIQEKTWATYRYVIDLSEKTIAITVTDADGKVFIDNDTTQNAFYGNCSDLAKIQFKIPSKNGKGGTNAADYYVDNFKVYYNTNEQDNDTEDDGTGDGSTTDSSAPAIVEIPDGATKVFREEFDGTALPSGFSGAWNLDAESQQLNIAGNVNNNQIPRITFGVVSDVEKYTVEFDMKRTDDVDSAYVQIKYFDSTGTEISLSDTNGQKFRLRSVENGKTIYTPVADYTVSTGKWAHYKYELDMDNQQITATVTDNEGTTYTSLQAAFFASCENVCELQFYIPGAATDAKYSIDNFVAYYTGGSLGGDDGTGDAGTPINYIYNPGFEIINDNPGEYFTGDGAQGWSRYGSWPYGTREVDNEVFHSGDYSMKLGGNELTHEVSIRQQINGLTPDKYYKLSCYIKAEKYYPAAASKATGPFLRVDAANTSATRYWIAHLPTISQAENTYDWTYTEIVFTPASDSIYLQCRMPLGTGLVWFDDLSLVEYEPYVSVALSQNSAVLQGGEELQLTAAPYPVKGGDVIKWESSNPEIATVDENGKVTASSTNSGEAIITATVTEQICSSALKVTDVDVKDYCKVTVNAGESVEPIKAVKVDVKKLKLVIGESGATINLFTTPVVAKDTTDFVWTTSDSSVAVVTGGYVVPVGEGTAIITASVQGNKSIADYCEVIVTKKETTSLKTSDFEIQENSEFDKKIQDSGYPKLLFSYDDIARIRQNAKTSHTAYTFTMMEAYADELLKSDTMIHVYGKSGGRVLQGYLTNLIMTGYIKQDETYIDRAIEIILANAAEYTADEYYAMNGDIALGDAAQAYAVGYDWLYPFMTENDKKVIEDKLDEIGNRIYRLEEHTYTGNSLATNHSSVTFGGLGLIGLVRNNTSWINRATDVTIGYYGVSSDATGFYNEGTDYMMYGALGAVTYSAAYQRYSGVDLIEQYSYMEENMDMLLYYLLPDRDSVLPIGDSKGTLSPMGCWVYLISKYKNEVSLWQYLEMSGEEGTQLYGMAENGGNVASAAYILIWADTTLEAKTPAEADKPVVKYFDYGYNVYRDGWDDEMDTLISFVSGKTTHRGHNQRDENSFAFYAKGEDFAIDPGYSPSETISHNALLVDGVGQSVPGDQYDIYGEIIKSEQLAENIYYVEGDATATYPDRVSVSSYIRRMLVCTGDIPYIIVIDDIDKANDVKSNYSWLLQTSTTNKLLVEGNSAQIIGSNKGSVMNIQFPFEESVLMNIDPWAGRTFGGAQGDYVASAFSQTLEAIIPGADTRIVSVLTARGYDELAPVLEVSGTSDNGTIKLSYYNGKADVITLNGNTISYEQIDINVMDKPEVQEPLTKEELDALGATKGITVQISGTLQDFETIVTENKEILVNVEEFIAVFENYTAMDEAVKTQLRAAASDGTISFSTACEVIDANDSYNEELRHITVVVKEDAYKVAGSDINVSSAQDDKITIHAIDARTDQYQYPPENAIDGDLDTYFTIQGDTGESVVLELGTEYEVYAVGMAFNQGSARISRFDVQVSMDKENWKTVRCAVSGGATEALEGYSFVTSNAKYIKILGYGNSVNAWNAIREIEIYGMAVTQEEEPDPTPIPTATPTAAPTATPTAAPTATPTATPTAAPTATPTATPTVTPTDNQDSVADEADSAEPVQGGEASSPNTGDSSNLILWIVLVAVAILMCECSVRYKRKSKQ